MYKKARAPVEAIIMSKKAADNRIFLSLIQTIKRLTRTTGCLASELLKNKRLINRKKLIQDKKQS